MSLQKFEKGTPQLWPRWWNKKKAGVQIQSSREHATSDYEVSTKATMTCSKALDLLQLVYISRQC